MPLRAEKEKKKNFVLYKLSLLILWQSFEQLLFFLSISLYSVIVFLCGQWVDPEAKSTV